MKFLDTFERLHGFTLFSYAVFRLRTVEMPLASHLQSHQPMQSRRVLHSNAEGYYRKERVLLS